MLTNTCTYIKLTWDIHPLGASDHIPSTGLGTTPLSGRKDIQWSDASKTSNTIPNDAMVVLRSNSLAFEQSGLPSISPNYQSIYQALDFQKAGLSHRPTGKPHDSTWLSANGMWCRKHKSSHNQFLIQSPLSDGSRANTFNPNDTASMVLTNASVNQHPTCSLCQVQGEFWEIYHGYKNFNHPK